MKQVVQDILVDTNVHFLVGEKTGVAEDKLTCKTYDNHTSKR